MSPITRPGYDVVIGQTADQRAPDPNPCTLFFVGTSLRGTVARGFGMGNLLRVLGDRQNWSSLIDEALSAIAESAASSTSQWAISRVTGPAAVAASVVLNDSAAHPSIRVTAKEKGAWPNGASVVTTAPSSSTRRFTVTLDGDTLATSPAIDLLTDLVEWSHEDDVPFVVSILGSTLPAIGSSSLAGGDDDRAHINDASWGAAFDALPKNFGPGLLYVDTTDPDVRTLARQHGVATNRVPFFKAPLGASISDLETEQDEMRADTPSLAQVGGLFAGYAWTNPIPTDPMRRASAAAVQMGNQSRVLRDFYVSKTAFGATNAPLQSVLRLDSQFTEDERTELYASGINVLTNDGATTATWGYCTGSLEPSEQDLHHQIVEMALKWECEGPIAAADGQYITEQLRATTYASIQEICKRFQSVNALNGTDEDPGFVIDLDTLNTPQTAAGRQFYARLSIRHTGTVDWAQMTIYPNAPDTGTLG